MDNSINKKQKLIELKRIINTPVEYIPKKSDKDWIKIKKKYSILEGTIKYIITDKLIDRIQKYTNIYLSIPDIHMHKLIKKNSKNIGIIYLAMEKKSQKKYVGYTRLPLLTFIKYNIHRKIIGENNIFEKFPNIDIKNIVFRILEYIKFNEKKYLISRREQYKKKINKLSFKKKNIIKQSGGTNNNNNNINFDKRIQIYYDVMNSVKYKFKPFIGYIYLLENLKNNHKFIGGSDKELSKEKFIKKILTNIHDTELAEKLKIENLEFRLIEKFEAKSTFDFMLRIDYFKNEHNTINKGYNKQNCMEESKKLFINKLTTSIKEQLKKKFYIRIQQYIFNKKYVDNYNYNNVFGFIYMIEHKENKKKYINYAYNTTLKAIILNLYNKALADNIKHNKILKILMEEPYINFNFKIIKIKDIDDTKIDLNIETNDLINRYDTINNGYNIDYNDLKRKIMINKKMANK